LVTHLETKLGSRVDYVVADQLGNRYGRFHQHAVLAAEKLAEYPRTAIWAWLKERAGWSRILPFEEGAAYYIARYIGRDINRCDWSLRIGDRQLCDPGPTPMGRVVIAQSAHMPKAIFHNSSSSRKQ